MNIDNIVLYSASDKAAISYIGVTPSVYLVIASAYPLQTEDVISYGIFWILLSVRKDLVIKIVISLSLSCSLCLMKMMIWEEKVARQL